MTSTVDQSKKPTLPQPPLPQQPSLQDQLTQIRQQYAAVSELLWETIRSSFPESHEVTVSPHASNPLWELCFVRAPGLGGKPDPTGRMRICAATIPEITESQKKKVVRFLRGTSRPLEDAMQEHEIPHPVSYVEQKIADRIKWNAAASTWDSVTPPSAAESAKNILHFPK